MMMPKERLEEELEHMFREDLIVACQYWGIDVSSSKSGTQLSELLAKKMRSLEERKRIFSTFSDKEKDLLGMLTLNGGAMSYDRLKPYRKIYSYGQLNQTERDLRKRGIIIRRTMSRLTETGREVAEFKILDFFLPHLEEYFARKPEIDPEKPSKVKTIVNERDAMLVDMLLLVSYLAKNDVKMTSSWEFPKRDIDAIVEAMSETTEDRFDLVQRLARKAGAYEIVDKDRVVPGKVKALFAGCQEEVSKRILLSALGRTRAIWATAEQPTEYTLNLIICRLRDSNSEEWITVQEMREWIRSELFLEREPLKWIQVSEDRVAMALENPILLGLLEGGYSGKALHAVKLTDVGETVIAREPRENARPHDTFIVQPNFEMTVFTSEMGYFKLYKLMLLSEPVRTDVVSTFKITEQSIFQAVEMGIRDKEIIEFLDNESSKPIPANVSRSIKDWTSQTIFASLDKVTLFETESERDMEHLMLLDEFKEYVVKRVGPTAAVIQGKMSEFVEEMRDLKCHVDREDIKDRRRTIPETQDIDENLLLYGEQSVSDVPEACIGCPAIHSCNRVVKRKSESRKGNNVDHVEAA